MLQLTKTFIKDIMTEKDGVTFDPSRFWMSLGTLVYLGLSIFQVWKTGNFDFIAWASGFGIIQGAGAASIKMKETTEQKTGN